MGELTDLPRAASTGPAFEPPLLVQSGPTAALNPGETSCLACETPHPAVKHRDRVMLKAVSHLITHETVTAGSNSHSLHSYRLLLAEEKAAKLWIGSRVREAQYGTLRRGLSRLCDLVGWSAADRWLLVVRSGCSHRHLRERHSTFLMNEAQSAH